MWRRRLARAALDRLRHGGLLLALLSPQALLAVVSPDVGAVFGLRHTMQRSAFGTFSDMQLTPFGGISSEYSSEASATTMISMC